MLRDQPLTIMEITAGRVFSVVAYPREFVESALVLPLTLQSWSRLAEDRINKIDDPTKGLHLCSSQAGALHYGYKGFALASNATRAMNATTLSTRARTHQPYATLFSGESNF